MNRCKHYLDSIENDDEMLHQEADEHANHCSDCSYDKKIHEEMLSVLNNLSEPEYPNNLHEIIISSAFDKHSPDGSEQNFIDKLALNLLRPLEILAPVACIFMLACMIQLNTNTSDDRFEAKVSANVASKNENGIEPINKEVLERVSPDEVKEFLAKLDEFQRLHPESKSDRNYNNVEIRLVTDK